MIDACVLKFFFFLIEREKEQYVKEIYLWRNRFFLGRNKQVYYRV